MAICLAVRRSCREVARRAQRVTIDHDALEGHARRLATAAGRDHDRPAPAEDPERTAGLVLALDAVNFGSGYHDVVAKRPGLSGARTMAAGLRQEICRRGRLSAGWLESLTGQDCARLFGQDWRHPEQRELMGLFARALGDLGRFVATGYGGSFTAVVEAAGGSAQQLATSLLAMPFYRDRHELAGEVVHFYKRAQITAADLARALDNRAPADFGDLDQLTSFADNLVPHVLRVDGVLRYAPDLADRIDRGELLAPGSRDELEIRAAGVEAVELLTAQLQALGHPVRPMDLDLVLWCRGGEARYKAVRRHRCRSVHY